MKASRREFICRTGQVLGATAFATGVRQFSLVNALAAPPDNYRALVCVFLSGGNDANNTIVPLDAAGYGAYSSVRSGPGLAIAPDQLLSITPPALGTPFGLHPSLSELHALWNAGRLAVVCNVGPLVHPMTREQYRGNLVPKPYQLFSHSDQVTQFQTSISNSRSQTGWAGRIADRTGGFNGTSSFPMVVTVAGTAIFGQGQVTRPLGIAPAPTALDRVLVLNGFGTAADEAARRNAMNHLRTIDRSSELVKATGDATEQALLIAQAFGSDPTLTTVFPETGLGNQLKQIAKVIKLNLTSPTLGLTRQIFFCSLGGFDTHQDQPTNQSNLLRTLSQALKAFDDATIELAIADRVTTFTLSDFGRTLQPSGTGTSVGTDHGWGSHLFVMGGAVRGGNFYGQPGANGSLFPALQLSGPNDTDSRGRWIPTVAVDQYAATLATWYGLSSTDLATVFPLIGNFASSNLGFMSA
jgi:uncharacterized protein (DUF1501 family)